MSNKVEEVKEVEEIKVFIKKLQNQIKNNIKKNIKYNYVVLNLQKNVNKLTELLENNDVIKYIINNFNYYNPIFKDKDNEKNTWYLIISGFKYGAKKNSPRELGLIAHKKIFNIDNFIIKFKTKLLYSSILFPKPSNEESINIVKHIQFGINLYLENKIKYNEETNYIKEETNYIKKKSKKTKLKKPTIYSFIEKEIEKKKFKNQIIEKNEKNEKNKKN